MVSRMKTEDFEGEPVVHILAPEYIPISEGKSIELEYYPKRDRMWVDNMTASLRPTAGLRTTAASVKTAAIE